MLGKWADFVQRAGTRSRLKTRGKTRSSRWEYILSSKGQVSDLGESAVVHQVQTNLLSVANKSELGDKNHAVVKDAEILAVAGSDTTRVRQEKEARTVGDMLSR